MLYNNTEYTHPRCHDSESYRNPFNGHSCSEHKDTLCIDWIDVLEKEQVEELINSCPGSCSVLECMNTTEANLFPPPVAMESYLEENSSTAPNNSAVIVALSAIGLMLFGFLVIRHRCMTKNSSNSNKHSSTNEDQSTREGSSEYDSALQGRKRVSIDIICSNIEESIRDDGLPTPRWIPELNRSYSTDNSMKDCDISDAQSNISYGDAIVPTPRNSPTNELQLEGSSEQLSNRRLSEVSPSGSVSVIHLLGALRSYDDESEYGAPIISP